MLLLDKYLGIQFAKYFCLVLSALVAIYFLVDFFERIDDFLGQGKNISLAISYFLLKIPTMIDTIYPISILLAGVITLGVLSHNHEFMSLKAAGVSTFRICLPIIAAALLSTLAATAMAEWVLPQTTTETNRIWHEEIHHQIPKGIIRKGRVYHRGERGIYSFVRTDVSQDIFHNFIYSELDQSFKLTMHLSADKASWADGQWTFQDGRLEKAGQGKANETKVETFSKINLHLPETPTDFFIPEYRVKEQSISNLFHAATTKKSQEAWFEFHNRLSFIIIGLPLILIGLPVLLIVTQKWGHDLTLALPISCGIAFSMWGAWSAAQSMSKAYTINPIFSAWTLHLLVGSFGFWLLKRQDT